MYDMAKLIDSDKLVFILNKIKALLGGYVVKENGKGLSTNDFTTAEKNKLDSLQNYTLPTASASTLGGVKVGSGLAINEGVLSATGGGTADAVDWANVTNRPTKLSEFTNDQNFVDNTVNNLTNYYKKSDVYTKTEVTDLLAAINSVELHKCTEAEYNPTTMLPTITNPNSSTIYLVPKDGDESNNVYIEYIYVNNDFEKIGDTEVDLSNYWNKTELTVMTNAEVETLWNQVFPS